MQVDGKISPNFKQLIYGEYTGNASNNRTITLSISPTILIIYSASSYRDNNDGLFQLHLIFPTICYTGISVSHNLGGASSASLRLSGNTLSLSYNGLGNYACLYNTGNILYKYIAII